jgi:hypothetical protein
MKASWISPSKSRSNGIQWVSTYQGEHQIHSSQPNTLFPTDNEVVNLTGLLETKGMSVSSGKQ